MDARVEEGRRPAKGVPSVKLSDTGLKVSKLGFGTYDFGAESESIAPEEGARILTEAFKLGITLWDTSDDYGSHPHVARALEQLPRKEVVVSTKTRARTGKGAERSLAKSLKELGTDYVDIFLMHRVKAEWIQGCRGVFTNLRELKATGAARAIGLSTHSVAVVRQASVFEEVDVILTILSKASQATINRLHREIPLEDGSMGEMFEAAQKAHNRGKGVLAMKVLGTGAEPLVRIYRSAIGSIARLPFVDAALVGMKSLDEVRKNAAVVSSA